jgi:pyridoxine 5'-phosphate synthase PdxJ
LDILKKTNIKQLFEPIETYVTLSSDIGFTKSQNFKGFIDIALNKVNKNDEYEISVFITEDKEHISLAKSIGIKTIQITNKNNSDLLDDEINALSQLSIKIKKFIDDN